MSTTLDVSLKVLYVQGLAAEVDRTAAEQLKTASAELQITTIAGSAAALAELRRTPGWQALFASPSLPQNEVLALIASLRRDRIPIAIVPILDDAHQDLFASAVATGADDVLVRRGGALVNINETLTRIRQSPHLFPAEQRRRISVLYAGRDPLVWNLLDQVPFVKADRVATGIDGTCSVRRPGSGDDSMRTDAVIIDEAPGDAHPLQVLKSVKAQASDLPVIMLTSAGAADIATAALELGADDTVLKTGIFRRRLIATLRRVHQRLEMSAQQQETRTREERLRQIVENVPTGIMVVSGDGRVLAMNAAALHLFNASKPRDIVGRDFLDLVGPAHRDAITDLIHQVTRGEGGGLAFEAHALDGARLQARIDAVVLERDARGGRGVVASITRAGSRQASAEADPEAPSELGGLRDALQTLERHYAELEDARSRERATWETDRQRLETRLEEAARLAAEREAIQERLDEVTAELARTSQSFAAERQALERRLHELESAAREATEAGASIADLERALEAVRDEQRQAIAAHALERTGWQDIRTDLEARVQQLDALHHSEQDTLVASLRQDVQRLEQSLADEGARWNTTVERLESELRNAREALWAEHTGRDAARATFEAELEALRSARDTERDEWKEARSALERELSATRATLDERDAEIDRVTREFDQQVEALRTALDAERGGWNDARGALERDLAGARTAASDREAERDRLRHEYEEHTQSLRATLDAERDEWQASREALEQARRQVEAALEDERAAATERRVAFEEERRQLLERGVQAGDLAEERSRLLAELEAMRRQSTTERDALEHELAGARERAERAEETVSALTEEYDATRARLEQARDEVQGELARTRAEMDARIAQMDAALADAQARSDAASAERDELRQQLTAGQSALEQSTAAERAEWERRLAVLEAALAAATEEAARHEAAWQEERTSLVQAAAGARTLADQERGHLVSLHARESEEWRQAVEHARTERDQAMARVSALTSDLESTNRQLVELDYARAAVEIARRDQEDAHQRVAALEAELGDTKRQIGEIEPLRSALSTARTEQAQLQSGFSALEQNLAEARTLADQRQRIVDALEAELGDAHRRAGELEQVRAELGTATIDRAQLQSRVEALEQELAEVRKIADQHQRLTETLEAARDEIRHTDAAHHAEREEWHRGRQAIERELHELEARHRRERDEWDRLRPQLEAEAGEAARLVREHQFLNNTIAALRAECSALSGSLAEERVDHDRHRHELDTLRGALIDSQAHLSELDAALDRASRSAEDQLAREAARHEARERVLEDQLRDLSSRLARAAEEAEIVRNGLQADYSRAADGQARLVASDVFGYAVTSATGELVRCNDSFARIFGYADAAEAQARTAGRPFPGLANRPDVAARLATEGHVSRMMSCVERIDGRAVRIIEHATTLNEPADTDSHRQLVEHIVVAGPAGPTLEDIQHRRLQEVGTLTTAMMPELESLSATLHARSVELARLAETRKTLGLQADEMRTTSERVALLLRQLGGFSRRQVRAPEPIDLGQVVLDAEPMLARLVGDYIAFATELGATTPVTVQRDDADQLLTSLVTLARDLLPTGGSVHVQVRQEETDGSSATGLGVPGPVMAVKAAGYGVQFPGALPSLELAARRCGGTVHVSGEPGRLVRVEVLFPRCGMPLA